MAKTVELSAHAAGMGKYRIGQSTVVTMDTKETVYLETGVVNIVPVWHWLLDT